MSKEKKRSRQGPQSTEKERPFACTTCGKTFTYNSRLQEHELIHTGDRAFACSKCSKCFRTKKCLKKHQIFHTDEWPFACSKCDKKFKRRRDVKYHEMIHIEESEKPFSCSQCDKRFISASTLRSHELVHSGEKQFACIKCDRRFSTSTNLRKHERNNIANVVCPLRKKQKTTPHKIVIKEPVKVPIPPQLGPTADRPFPCNICNKLFKQKSSLSTHQLIHTGEKPFECAVCQKKFSRKHHWQSHMHSHTGKKPFGCDLCDKTFIQRNELKRHELVHKKIKPFKCSHCDRAFTCKSSLRNHLKKYTFESNQKAPDLEPPASSISSDSLNSPTDLKLDFSENLDPLQNDSSESTSQNFDCTNEVQTDPLMTEATLTQKVCSSVKEEQVVGSIKVEPFDEITIKEEEIS